MSDEDVAAAARAWCTVSREWVETARGPAEQKLADELQLWIVELLASHPRWELEGRWFDGLQIQECVAGHDGAVNIRGFIWRIDTQQQYPFKAELMLTDERMAGFQLVVAKPLATKSTDPDWIFRFRKEASPNS